MTDSSILPNIDLTTEQGMTLDLTIRRSHVHLSPNETAEFEKSVPISR